MLRALAHPVRLRMLGLLRADGPATATTLATRLGLNTGATSYHLRQLAQHGFVVEDSERGNGRDRWWRAAHRSTRTDEPGPGEAEAQENLDAYLQAVATIHTEQLQRAVEERPLLPPEWREAETFSDWMVRLTPKRARALVDALAAVVEDVEEDDAEEAADFTVQISAFPQPGRLGGES
ncbi:helix-turn-helix domain-containing protein [Nocardioides antri]|uniref:Helix-turn-helix domain-containing protein n=2 Tax=Nocardioides antri TaxID=2607659 RepID=A0A5B1M595_9ACTN|nr:helix-turn-helix domain-containing protein [Nocardioides antri]